MGRATLHGLAHARGRERLEGCRGARQRNRVYVISIPPYLGSGMTAEIWFEKGVGMVREEEIHHGTVGETRTRLVRFEPAPRGAREMPR